MNMEEDVTFGDEKQMINFILQNLSNESKGKITYEMVDAFIDAMLEFYEEEGFFDEPANENEEVEIDEERMIDYIKKRLDGKYTLTDSEIDEILDLEYEYNQEDGIYE